ncbi:MAG TPA: competence/damage-inducible protein A [Egibacteraceae bacterium]|nr:competence/damage-inducible protein A [Egibacteraceae bacterium]
MSDSPDRGGRLSAELIAVGTELLLGDSVDTNSGWISGRLAEIGVDVFRHMTVGDNVQRLASAVREAAARADAVIVTGGLGPTQDDLTRDAVALVAGVALERRPELVAYVTEYFAARGREMPERNLVQADMPAGARVLSPVGTAAGFAVAVQAATVYCVPGVPAEMRAMIAGDVIPELSRRRGAGSTVSRVIRTAGMSESGVAELCSPIVRRLDETQGATIAFLASRGETRVRVTVSAASRDQALALTDPVVDEIVDLLGAGVTGIDDEGVEHAVARQLMAAKQTLAVAESITGGCVGGRLVSVPGASDWFRGGVIVYATDLKATLAGVDQAVLDAHGPVSEEAAAALAVGVRQRLRADVGLGVVGVAGPTTQNGKPVGTVCLAVGLEDAPSATQTLQLPSWGRTELQEFAGSFALDFLRRQLAERA